MAAQPSPKEFQPYRKVQGDAEKELRRILERTAKLIEARIARMRPGIGGVVRAAQLRTTLAAVRRLQRAMWVGAINPTVAAEIEAALEAGESAVDALTRVAYGALNEPAAKVLVDGLRAAAQSGLKSDAARKRRELSERVYRLAALHEGKVEETIRAGIISNLSAKELASDVYKYVSPNTPGGASYAAMRLARTEINNAFHERQIAGAKRPGVSAVQWNLSGSHKVPDECNLYAAHEPYPPDEVPDKPHPQCFCYLTYVTTPPHIFQKALEAGAYDDELDRRIKANLDRVAGRVPADDKPKPIERTQTPSEVKETVVPVNKRNGKEVKYPKAYHISLFADDIKRNGFKSGKGETNRAHFGAGVYLYTDKTPADRYLEGMRDYVDDDFEMFDVQASVVNPFVVKAKGTDTDPDKLMMEALIKAKVQKRSEGVLGAEEIRRRLQAKGYDGVEVKQDGFNDEVGGSQLLVFDPVDAIANSSDVQQPTKKATSTKITDDQVESLRTYTGSVYGDINFGLRDGDDLAPSLDRVVSDLDDIFKTPQVRLRGPKTVYRGIATLHRVFPDGVSVGDVLEDPAFTSTSANEESIEKFIRFGTDPAVFEIRLPAGARALDVNSTLGDNGLESEQEWLLPRGSKFRVIAIRGSKYVLELMGDDAGVVPDERARGLE